jgi:DNA-binding winged helix-turn-helix (wHTH) protein
VFRFGAFELDVQSQQVCKNGVRIRLQTKPFQLLLMLVERPGQVVTREEFHRVLWGGDSFGEFDHNLNNAINKLRRALNDQAGSPRYIETLPRIGYRFVAPMERLSQPAESATGEPMVAAEPPSARGATWKLGAQPVILALACLTIGAMVAVAYNHRWPTPTAFAAPAAGAAAENRKADLDAYEYYMKGRYFWNKRSRPQVLLAIKYFQEAINKDPNYALAYSGLGDSYSVLGMTMSNPRDYYQKAREAALKSVKLDPKSAEAHTSLAVVYLNDWRFAEATAEFQEAISLNPRYPTAHHWYGLHLRIVGRTNEGLKELELAHRLDPVSLPISFALANAYRKDGYYAEAERQFAEIVRFDSTFRRVDAGLALLYATQHRLPKTFAFNARWGGSVEDDPAVSEYVAVGLYLAGQKKEAFQLMTQLTQQVKSSEGCFPFLLAAMGEKEQSINCLEKGYEQGAGYMPQIKTDPVLRELRSDPRFQALLDRVGFPSGRTPAVQ